jgi:hypothetical protein
MNGFSSGLLHSRQPSSAAEEPMWSLRLAGRTRCVNDRSPDTNRPARKGLGQRSSARADRHRSHSLPLCRNAPMVRQISHVRACRPPSAASATAPNAQNRNVMGQGCLAFRLPTSESDRREEGTGDGKNHRRIGHGHVRCCNPTRLGDDAYVIAQKIRHGTVPCDSDIR